MKRLILFLIAAAVAWYLAKSFGLISPAGPTAAPNGSPVERARAAAAASDARTNAGAAVAREADQSGSAGVSENMTPDQVRSLIGPPDDVETETTASGGTRETWTYRSVGKTVVFENGVAVSIH